MNDFIWFRLLIRGIGVLLIGLSLPAALSTVGWFGQLGNSWGALDGYALYVAAQVVAHVAQLFMGLYLLIGGNRLIRYCARDVMRPLQRCAVCGYDLSGISVPACPECGVELNRPAGPAPPPGSTPGGGS